MSDQQPATATGPVASDPVARRRRGRETAADMVRSLLVVLVLVFVVVALNAQPEPDQEVRRFDYTAVLAQAREQAPYDVLAPVGLPRSWRATSARTGRDGDAFTWHLGLVTPQDDYAAVEQSDGDPEGFLDHVVGAADAAGTVQIGGATWRRLEGGEHEPRALVLDAAPVTTVVAGGASWRELRALAAALPTS